MHVFRINPRVAYYGYGNDATEFRGGGGGGERFILTLHTASVLERNRQHCCRERGTEENGTGEGKGEGT